VDWVRREEKVFIHGTYVHAGVPVRSFPFP
jgi:hypothetical protein